MDLEQYWQAVLAQDAEGMRGYFHENAWVNWHNTNEQFTVEEFIRANCEYPGDWDGEIERVEKAGERIVMVVHVFSREYSFHVASFIQTKDGKIAGIDEYWGDDGPAPRWRLEMGIGKTIKLM